MRKVLVKGYLKTIRIVPDRKQVVEGRKPMGYLPLAQMQVESTKNKIQIEYRGEVVDCEEAAFTGSARIIGACADPRIETYAQVDVAIRAESYLRFILSYQRCRALVIARTEAEARMIFPLGLEWEWDQKSKCWRDEHGKEEVFEWGNPEELKCYEAGTDAYAGTEEVVTYWIEDN